MDRKKYRNLLMLMLGLCIGMLTVLPGVAHAGTSGNSICISSPQYTAPSGSAAAGSGLVPTVINGGMNIIVSIFSAINNILTQIAATFYTGILNNPDFQKVAGAIILLYITIYGVMIMFSLAPVSTSEVIKRLVRLAIIYAVLSPDGWTFFYKYIGSLFMGGMNELIAQFAATSVGVSTTVAASATTAPALDPAAISMLAPPIALVFSAKFIVAIISLFTTGFMGPILAIFLIWGFVEFLFMVIGAISTYVKAMVGLTFLFGIAPIFFLFLLFERTRQMFIGWVNQVLAFALQPVLLFAFLAFYVTLLTSALNSIMNAADYCYVTWFSFPGGLWDVQFWRPAPMDATGNVQIKTGAWVGPPPISLISVLLFVLLCHLGKSFSKFIEQLARDLSNGAGPGIVGGDPVKHWFRNRMGGTSPNPVSFALGALFGGVKGVSGWAGSKFGGGTGAADMVSRRAMGPAAQRPQPAVTPAPASTQPPVNQAQNRGAQTQNPQAAPQNPYAYENQSKTPNPYAYETHTPGSAASSTMTTQEALKQLSDGFKLANTNAERDEIAQAIEKITGKKFNPDE